MKRDCLKLYLLFLFFPLQLFAQQIQVNGNVQDAQGEPIIGANILPQFGIK